MSLTFSSLREDESSPFKARPASMAVPLREMDEEGRREFWANLALRHCRGIGVRTRARLLNFFGSAYQAVQHRKFWRQAQVREECAREFSREKWRIPAKKEWDEAAASRAGILLWTSSLYPGRLRELVDPPSFLYFLGDLSLLLAPTVAVVGSRRPSARGLKNAANISRALSARGLSVASGMALGIDREAHLAALAETGKSIGVLGTGIDIFYPFHNRDVYAKMLDHGLLMSEFSPKQPPCGLNFPIRNRLISGLSVGVLVIEAAAKSGSLITASYALEQNREVFAMSDKQGSAGCLNLIAQGAHPVQDVNDVLLELADLLKDFSPPSPAGHDELDIPDLSLADENAAEAADTVSQDDFEGRELVEKSCQDDLAEAIMCLLQKGPRQLEQLVCELDSDINEINSKLIFLELLGRIRRLPGASFEVP